MRTMHKGAWAAAAAALALFVSACSSSGGSADNPSAAASQPAGASSGAATGASSGAATGAAAEGTTVKVGLICSCSGYPYAGNSVAIVNTYKSYITTVNDAGGINGHKIEIVQKDDQSQAGLAQVAVDELVAAKVAAIVDQSNVDTAWSAKITAAKIPVVGTNMSNRPFAANPYFFPEGMTVDNGTVAMVDTAKKNGVTKVGVLYCAETPSCQDLVGAIKPVAESAGLQVVYTGSAASNAPNFTAQCIAAKQAGVEGLLVFLSGEIIARVGPDCDRQDFDVKYFALGSGFFWVMESAAGIKDNYYGVFPHYPLFGGGPVDEVYEQVEKTNPGISAKSNATWSQNAIGGWQAAKLMAKAIELSGAAPDATVTPETILSGLYKIKDETLGGGSPPLTFTKGAKSNSIGCYFIGTLANGGTPSVQNDGKPYCVK